MWHKITQKTCYAVIREMLTEIGGKASSEGICTYTVQIHWDDLHKSDKTVLHTPQGDTLSFMQLFKQKIAAACGEQPVTHLKEGLVVDTTTDPPMVYTEEEYNRTHPQALSEGFAEELDAMTKSCIQKEFLQIDQKAKEHLPASMNGQTEINLRDGTKGYHIKTIDVKGKQVFFIVKATKSADWREPFHLTKAEEKLLNDPRDTACVFILRAYSWEDKNHYQTMMIGRDMFRAMFNIDDDTNIVQCCA